MPSVSVIVPVYNAENTLPKCIDSILSQTFHDYELLLVDDGSTDGSPEICDKYAEIDLRVKVWHKPNGGACSSRNFGIDRAVGKYICFADSDDYVSEKWLEDLVDAAEQYPDSLVLSNVQMIEKDRTYLRYQGYSGLHDIEDIWRWGYWGYSVNKIYRKSIIDQLNLRYDESLRVYEDELFVSMYCAEIKSAYVIPSVGYYYILQNFENKYVGDLNFGYIMYQYREVKKHNKKCSDYLVDRVVMNAYKQIIDNSDSCDSVIASLKKDVGKDIRFVQGGRKAGLKLLSRSNSFLVWKTVFRIYARFKFI